MADPEQIQLFVQLEMNGSTPIVPALRTSHVSEKSGVLGIVVAILSLR